MTYNEATNKNMPYLFRIGLILMLFGLLSLAMAPNALATGVYLQKVPADFPGADQACNLCHDPIPVLTDFGQEFKASGYDFDVLLGEQDEPGDEGGSVVGNDSEPTEDTTSAGEAEPVEKQDANIQLILPGSVERGEQTLLLAEVTVDGNPVSGKEVEFFEETDFFVQEKMDIGKATTNSDGIAEINYWPRAAEENVKLVASIAGDNEINSAQTEAELSLIVAGPIIKPFEGLAVPFVGPWLIGLVAGAIWATYFYAGYKVLGIRKFGKTREQEAYHEEEERKQAQA